MSVYKMQKKGRSGRRVEVRAERFEVNIPAIVICVVLAVAIWLYIVNFSWSSEENLPEQLPAETETVPAESESAPGSAESAADAVASAGERACV